MINQGEVQRRLKEYHDLLETSLTRETKGFRDVQRQVDNALFDLVQSERYVPEVDKVIRERAAVHKKFPNYTTKQIASILTLPKRPRFLGEQPRYEQSEKDVNL